jgi:hypothetical protein
MLLLVFETVLAHLPVDAGEQPRRLTAGIDGGANPRSGVPLSRARNLQEGAAQMASGERLGATEDRRRVARIARRGGVTRGEQDPASGAGRRRRTAG